MSRMAARVTAVECPRCPVEMSDATIPDAATFGRCRRALTLPSLNGKSDRVEEERMQKVTGIGGVFFRARDPDAMVRWYRDHLGVAPPPASYGEPSWWQDAGPTIFTAMSADSGHFERPEQSWAINFRVDDLDAMVAQLRAAGIDVDADPQNYPNGRFASTRDPEGNPIQLWEPAGADG